MLTSKVKYLGELRTECTHINSNSVILTDAPLDNKGKGSNFSPTDLVATAYASCMMTIMGIYCDEHGIEFIDAEANVLKIMGSNPRRIEKINIEFDFKANNWDEKTAQKVINAGKTCPVAKTLGENVEVEFTFNF
jgi:putative redox protein